jgi:cytochrome c-type biogenesis protein CcmH/NrfF
VLASLDQTAVLVAVPVSVALAAVGVWAAYVRRSKK